MATVQAADFPMAARRPMLPDQARAGIRRRLDLLAEAAKATRLASQNAGFDGRLDPVRRLHDHDRAAAQTGRLGAAAGPGGGVLGARAEAGAWRMPAHAPGGRA